MNSRVLIPLVAVLGVGAVGIAVAVNYAGANKKIGWDCSTAIAAAKARGVANPNNDPNVQALCTADQVAQYGAPTASAGSIYDPAGNAGGIPGLLEGIGSMVVAPFEKWL